MTEPNISVTEGIDSIENLKNIRLLTFWSSKPELWFKQLESQFFIYNVKGDKSKYHITVAHLPPEIFSEVYDVISKPPVNDLYNFLKNIILSRLTLSEEARLDKLLSSSELGDKKPSTYNRELLQIAGDKTIDEKLIIKVWRRRLPDVIEIAPTSSSQHDLSHLLNLADKI